MSTPKTPAPTAKFMSRVKRHLLPDSALPDPEPAPAPEPPPAPPAGDAPPPPPPAAGDTPPEPPPAPPAAGDTPPPPPPAEPPPPPQPAPPAPKPRARPVVKEEDFEPAPAPAAPVQAQTIEEALGYEPTEDEAEYLETLRWAEGLEGRKDLKGAFAREVERLKKVRAFAETWHAENPGETFDPATAELKDGTSYRAVAGRAALTADQRRRLDLERVKAEADARTQAAIEKNRIETEQRLLEIETKPKIEQAMREQEGRLLEGLTIDADAEVNEDLVKLARERGLDALAEELPAEGAIVRRHTEAARERTRALLEIHAGLAAPDLTKDTHAWLVDFVTKEADWFAANGGEARVREDGATFLPPAKYSQLKPEARGRYWTFSREQMVTMIAHRAKEEMQGELERHREAIRRRDEALAKRRKPPPAPPASATPPPAGATPPPPAEPPPEAPRLRPAPAGHPGTPPPPPTPNRVKQRLGLS